MQKIYLTLAVFCAALFAACSNSDKEANKNFVNASLKVAKAAEIFDKADYAAARDLCIQAKSEVDRILAQYPDSQIALRVVSQPDTQIGACSFRNLCDSIIPRLNKFNTPHTNEISLAWAIAADNQDTKLRENGFFALGTYILNKCKSGGKNFFKEPNLAVVACTANVLDTVKKTSLAAERAHVFDGAAAPLKNEGGTGAKSVAAKSEKIKDEAAFLSQARTDAALVSYDLHAIDALDKKVGAAKTLSDPSEFLKILHNAFAVSQNITMRDTRDIAMGRIGAVFVKFGAIKQAVEIAAQIRTQKPLVELMLLLSETATGKDDCAAALMVSKNIKDQNQRDNFYAKLAQTSAPTIGEQAIKIAMMINDKDKRHCALINLGENSNNVSVIAGAVSEIDFNASADWIRNYRENEKIASDPSGAVEAIRKFAELARVLSAHDITLARKINARAMSIELPASVSPEIKKELTYAYMLAALNLADFGDGAKALEFLTKKMHLLDVKSAFAQYATIAAQSYTKDTSAAMKALAVCANICASMNPEDRVKNSVYLAFVMQLNGVSRADSVNVLGQFLPKFAK